MRISLVLAGLALAAGMNSAQAGLVEGIQASSKGDFQQALVEVDLLTGRHHQIRAQLSKIGCPIKGDLKYGARRSNPDGGISLHSYRVDFIHPVRRERIVVTAPVPKEDNLWAFFARQFSLLPCEF